MAKYLRHKISKKKEQLQNDHDEAILKEPESDSKEQFLSFLGIADLYSRFIENYPSKMEPLQKLLKNMAGYEDQADDGYYLDEPAGSFEQDLVYALDAGVRHTVNQALAQAIKPIKHHLLGFAEQQGWVAPSGIQSIMEPSLSAGTQAAKQRNKEK
ncbi:hypothetical protein NDU88_006283 [Pleurodeles waltl]|uniref:Uncharacterized protein n=1 Tax=Pleurodeles waltl TaxID=8319 RepID=A0AAV7MBS0_PLEWA|nr:hypothetical protein NDU88_006283 [Pleurodeles waltl]